MGDIAKLGAGRILRPEVARRSAAGGLAGGIGIGGLVRSLWLAAGGASAGMREGAGLDAAFGGLGGDLPAERRVPRRLSELMGDWVRVLARTVASTELVGWHPPYGLLSMLHIVLLASPCAAVAQSERHGDCYLRIEFQENSTAHRQPCSDREIFEVVAGPISVRVEIEDSTASISILERDITYFSERQTERFRLSRIGATLPIYNLIAKHYVSGAFNEPVGSIFFKFVKDAE